MDWLKTFLSQIQTLWSRWDASQRVIIAGAAVICVIAVAGTMYWAVQPDYVLLRSNLSPQESGNIVGLLENEQIAFKLNFSGSSVSVSRSDFAQAQLALRDMPAAGQATEVPVASSMFGSPEETQNRLKRDQELRIQRSIEMIQGIRHAQVMVSQPTPSPFAVERMAPSASIVIEPQQGVHISPATAQSIIAMVSQSVEGLLPEDVTVVDTNGRQLSASTAADAMLASQLDYQRRVEVERASKAEIMLGRLLGPDRATVQVSADIVFDKREVIQKSFDPDAKAAKEETIQKESRSNSITSGLSGADANAIPNLLNGNSGLAGDFKTETSTFKYQTGATTETLTENPGRINRLTVSAIVDLESANVEGADPAAAAAPRADITAEQVEQIIRQAVGFDELRGDEITVAIARLVQPPSPVAPPAPLAWWETWGPIVQWGILGLSMGALVIVGLMLVRRMTPVQVGTTAETPLSLEEMRRVMALSEQARQNPDVVASILQNWMETDSERQQSPVASPEPAPQRRAA